MIESARAPIVEHARTRPAAIRDERTTADISSSCPGQRRERTPTDIHREAASGALAGCGVVRRAPDPLARMGIWRPRLKGTGGPYPPDLRLFPCLSTLMSPTNVFPQKSRSPQLWVSMVLPL